MCTCTQICVLTHMYTFTHMYTMGWHLCRAAGAASHGRLAPYACPRLQSALLHRPGRAGALRTPPPAATELITSRTRERIFCLPVPAYSSVILCKIANCEIGALCIQASFLVDAGSFKLQVCTCCSSSCVLTVSCGFAAPRLYVPFTKNMLARRNPLAIAAQLALHVRNECACPATSCSTKRKQCVLAYCMRLLQATCQLLKPGLRL